MRTLDEATYAANQASNRRYATASPAPAASRPTTRAVAASPAPAASRPTTRAVAASPAPVASRPTTRSVADTPTRTTPSYSDEFLSREPSTRVPDFSDTRSRNGQPVALPGSGSIVGLPRALSEREIQEIKTFRDQQNAAKAAAGLSVGSLPSSRVGGASPAPALSQREIQEIKASRDQQYDEFNQRVADTTGRSVGSSPSSLLGLPRALSERELIEYQNQQAAAAAASRPAGLISNSEDQAGSFGMAPTPNPNQPNTSAQSQPSTWSTPAQAQSSTWSTPAQAQSNTPSLVQPNTSSPVQPNTATPAFKKGGYVRSADGIAVRGKTKAAQYNKGGAVSSASRRGDGIAVKGKTKATQYNKGGTVYSGSSRGDGIATKGKTRGRIY